MNAQLTLAAQSVAGPVIEIILLIIGAAVIGFLTAWYYQKSYYTPIIKKLESDKVDLNKQIDSLKAEARKLNEKILAMEKSLEEKENEIICLKKSEKESEPLST